MWSGDAHVRVRRPFLVHVLADSPRLPRRPLRSLTLQHGWGCQVNAPLGFRYLQSAAESVVEDLDRVVAGGREMSSNERSTKAAQNELVLALHEIGASFRHGFGVKKDKAMVRFTLPPCCG